MPYIKPERRQALDKHTLYDIGARCRDSGELNFAMSQLAKGYLDIMGERYPVMGDIVDAFDNAKDEFRRQVQHPYEDRKIEQNGGLW